MRLHTILLVPVLLVAIAPAAWSQGQNNFHPGFDAKRPWDMSPSEKKVMRMDTNADNKISIDEFKGSPEKFKKIDKNGDHYLTADEFAASGAGRGKKRKNHRRSKGGDTSATASIHGSHSRRSAGRPHGKQLSNAEIRQDVVGNTLDFVVPSNGKHLYLYFAPDGKIMQKVGNAPKLLKKRWFINQKDMLCRTYGHDNKRSCVKVMRTKDPHSMKMANKRLHFEAKILKGRQLPK